jgi:5-methylcytosine-specific restriction protein A
MKVTDGMIQQFYNSRVWRMLRQGVLNEHPLCQTCLLDNKIITATCVHHSVNLRLGWEQRYDARLLFSLCDKCHQSIESEIYLEGQAVERRKQDDELKRLGG